MESLNLYEIEKFLVTQQTLFMAACLILVLLLIFIRQQRTMIGKMKLSEERFRHIADGSLDWIWETDAYGKYVYSSAAVEHILGCKPEEIVNRMYFYDLCFSEDRLRLKEHSLRMLKENVLTIKEQGRRRHKSGAEVVVQVRGFARLDDRGRIIGYRGVDRDVTREKQEEEKVKSLAKFPAENINKILRVSAEGKILFANEASNRLLSRFRTGRGGEVPERWAEVISAAIHNNEVMEFEVPVDEDIFLFHITPVPESLYANLYGLNITERKRMENELEKRRLALEEANRDLAVNERVLRKMLHDLEKVNAELKETQEELVQSQKMAAIGSLSSGIAHEIKNPLAIILQGVERLDKDIARDSPLKTYTTMIKNAASRTNRVIATLLTFARATRIKLTRLDVYEVINEALILLESELGNHGISVKVTPVSQAPLYVSGDSVALTQVFFVVFSNAIDAMPSGGELTVTLCAQPDPNEETGASCLIEVADSGQGISPEDLPFIFDPFYTTKEPGKGTGLGLSTAYLIIERHNGKIEVKSVPGKGTRFLITLPVTK